jgi:hypothetical protein
MWLILMHIPNHYKSESGYFYTSFVKDVSLTSELHYLFIIPSDQDVKLSLFFVT